MGRHSFSRRLQKASEGRRKKEEGRGKNEEWVVLHSKYNQGV